MIRKLYKSFGAIQKRLFWIAFIGLFVFGVTQVDISQVRGLLTALGLRIETVSTIQNLQDYNGSGSTIYVTDSLRGGPFTYKTGLVADNGVVFAATGKGSGFWVRQFDPAKGVSVDWWGTADAVGIQKAMNFAGIGGIINFSPNKTYASNVNLIPLASQIINGNGATFKRIADSIVTLTADANTTANTITVNAIPSTWKAGVSLQMFTDSTNLGSNNPVSILSISGNTVTFTNAIGSNVKTDATHPQRTLWPHDSTKVRYTFAMIIEGTTPLNYKISNLIFDGNRDSVKANYYWAVNPVIIASGTGGLVKIDRCQFYNIPNENIEGHGFHVTNCYIHNASGSFVHMSYSNTNLPNRTPAIISDNITDSTNRIPSTITGHSEGVITFSLTPGYITVTGNRFKNGSDAVFGVLANAGPTDFSSNGLRNVLISDNYALNFNNIFYSVTAQLPTAIKAGHIFVQGNVFDNCGINDFGSQRLAIDSAMDTLMIGNNMIVGGTTWSIPVQNSDSLQRYVLNNGNTTTPQKAAINIFGPIKAATATFTSLPDAQGDFVTLNSGVLQHRTNAEVKVDLNILGGVGSTNYIAKWTSSSALGTGLMTDNGTTVTVGGGMNINGRVQVYKGTIFGNADPATTNLVVSNSSQNSALLVGQTTSSYGLLQWNYNSNTTLATMSWMMNTGKGLTMDVNGVIASFGKIGYLTNPTMTAADSLVLTHKKYVDSSITYKPYVAKAVSYTAILTDRTIEVTATGTTQTLPTAVGIAGKEYVIKLTASGSATVATTSSQTIDGSTTYSLSAQYKYVFVQSNGANWIIIGSN